MNRNTTGVTNDVSIVSMLNIIYKMMSQILPSLSLHTRTTLYLYSNVRYLFIQHYVYYETETEVSTSLLNDKMLSIRYYLFITGSLTMNRIRQEYRTRIDRGMVY